MKIEKATPIDASLLTELTLRSKAHWNYTSEQIEMWRDELTITERYIANQAVYRLTDDRLVGFYAFNGIDAMKVKLNFFFIEPACIGKGYGKRLMEDFLQRVKDLGYTKVTLDADPNAENFYLKQGFQVIGQLPSSIKDRFLPIMELQFN